MPYIENNQKKIEERHKSAAHCERGNTIVNKYMKINDWENVDDATDDKSAYTFSTENRSLILSGAGYVWLDLLDIDTVV